MDLIKTEVSHVTLGKGIIVEQTDNTITVEFQDRKMPLSFPSAFEKYLTVSDDEAKAFIEAELEKVREFKKADKEKEIEKERGRINRIFYDDLVRNGKIKENEINEVGSDNVKKNISDEDISKLLQEYKNPSDKKKTASTKTNKPDSAAVIENTAFMCEDNDTLRPAVRKINQNKKIIKENDELEGVDDIVDEKTPNVIFSHKSVADAAADYKGKKVCILNYPSDLSNTKKHDIKSRSEEALFEISTLRKHLAQADCWEDFYLPHKSENNGLMSSTIIYIPGVIVFKKSSVNHEVMEESEWFNVDVLTCASPRVKKDKGSAYIYGDGSKSITEQEIKQLVYNRLERVFKVAHSQGAEVLILDDWGRKDSHIPEKLIAETYFKLVNKYGAWFDTIEIAIPQENTASASKKDTLEIYKSAFEDKKESKKSE